MEGTGIGARCSLDVAKRTRPGTEKAKSRTGFCFLVKKLQINGAGRLDHHGERVEDFDALALVLPEEGPKGCVGFSMGTGSRRQQGRRDWQ